jgi:hypothetical protein
LRGAYWGREKLIPIFFVIAFQGLDLATENWRTVYIAGRGDVAAEPKDIEAVMVLDNFILPMALDVFLLLGGLEVDCLGKGRCWGRCGAGQANFGEDGEREEGLQETTAAHGGRIHFFTNGGNIEHSTFNAEHPMAELQFQNCH